VEKRRLGRTEHLSSVVTFGAIAVGRGVNQTDANAVIDLVLDRGVNHIDVAPGYGNAMERLAPSMPAIRDQFSSAPRQESAPTKLLGRASARASSVSASSRLISSNSTASARSRNWTW
jgi:predicted aldo/keto reductase-like oxidoreductase